MSQPLTDVEMRILREFASGASDAEIAVRLLLYEQAVKARIRAILKKLGVRTRKEAAAQVGPVGSSRH